MKRNDSLNKQINVGSIIALLSNGIAKSSQLVSRAIITRASGAYGLGLFELVLSLTRWLALIGQGGLHQTIVQFTSSKRTRGDWNGIFNVFFQSLMMVLAITGMLCIALFATKGWVIETLIDGIKDDTLLVQVLLLTILLSLAHFIGSFFRGLKKLMLDQAINTLALPLLILLVSAYYFFLGDSFHIQTILWKVLIIYGALILVSLVGSFALSLKNVGQPNIHFQFGELLNYSWPIWVNSILNTSRSQFSRLLIPVFSTTVELGYFSAAYTLAFMASFVGNSFTPVNQYLVAEAHGAEDYQKIQHVYHNIISKSISFVILLMGGSIIFGKLVLGLLFGENFEIVYPLLIILIIGESINSIAGPSGNILLMTGHQKISTKIMFIGFLFLLVSCVILIPMYGALGSAISAAISISYINVSRVVQIRRLFKITPNYQSILKHNKHLILFILISFLANYFINSILSQYVFLALFLVIGGTLLIKVIRNI